MAPTAPWILTMVQYGTNGTVDSTNGTICLNGTVILLIVQFLESTDGKIGAKRHPGFYQWYNSWNLSMVQLTPTVPWILPMVQFLESTDGTIGANGTLYSTNGTKNPGIYRWYYCRQRTLDSSNGTISCRKVLPMVPLLEPCTSIATVNIHVT